MSGASSDSMGAAGSLDTLVSRRTLLVVAGVVNVELAAVVAYFAFTNATLSSPAFTIYGLCWLTVGGLVLWRFRPPAAARGARLRAGVVAAGYLAVLAVAGGTVGTTNPATPAGVSVTLLPPGWGPALVYGGERFAAILMPARVVGSLALAYLLYGRLLAASRVGWAGALGVFSCVSCSFPVVAGAVGSLLGGGGVAATFAAGLGYGVSTAVFLLTVAALWAGPALVDRLRT